MILKSLHCAQIMQYNNKSHVALVHWAKFLEFRIFAQINSENIILSEHERPMNFIIQSAAWFWNINWAVSSKAYLTPYFARRSFDKGADINFLRICEGAVNCLFRCFLLEDVTFLFNFIVEAAFKQSKITNVPITV